MRTYQYEVKKELAVIGDYDVIVVGAGLGGICASLSAARLGAKVVLVERNSILGGQAAEINTWGLDGFVDKYGKMCVAGIPWEILKKTVALGNSDPFWSRIDMDVLQNEGLASALRKMDVPEYLPYVDAKTYMNPLNDQYIDVNDYRAVATTLLEEANVDVLLGMPVVDALVENNKVQGIVVQGEFEKFAIFGKSVVDTSQNAVVCAHAGSQMKFTQAYMGSLPRVTGIDIQRVIDYIRQTDEEWLVRPMVDKRADADELESLVAKGYPLALQGFTKALDIAIADNPAFETLKENEGLNQVFFYEQDGKGAYWIFSKNFRHVDTTDPLAFSKGILTGRKQQRLTHEFFKKYVPGFENAMLLDPYANISKAYEMSLESSDFTRYAVTKEELETGKCAHPLPLIKVLGHPIMGTCLTGWWIPLPSLVPKNLEGILVTGKAACRKIHYIATCALVGQSAGAVAATSVLENVALMDCPIDKVQSNLQNQGVLY